MFIEKITPTPRQGTSKTWYVSNRRVYSLIFCHFASTIILEPQIFQFTEQIVFSTDIIFRWFAEAE
jgi:hypothetical protein